MTFKPQNQKELIFLRRLSQKLTKIGNAACDPENRRWRTEAAEYFSYLRALRTKFCVEEELVPAQPTETP